MNDPIHFKVKVERENHDQGPAHPAEECAEKCLTEKEKVKIEKAEEILEKGTMEKEEWNEEKGEGEKEEGGEREQQREFGASDVALEVMRWGLVHKNAPNTILTQQKVLGTSPILSLLFSR